MSVNQSETLVRFKVLKKHVKYKGKTIWKYEYLISDTLYRYTKPKGCMR